jgi:hypothetical protein
VADLNEQEEKSPFPALLNSESVSHEMDESGLKPWKDSEQRM